MRASVFCRVLVAGAGLAGLALAAPAYAQMPPGPPEAAEIAHCLCLRAAVDHMRADMTAQQGSYGASQSELGRLDAQLAQERSTLDVNNPQAVARFRQLLEQRDAVFRRSSGVMVSDASAATTRYNEGVAQYNAQCANRPSNPDVVARVQSTLSCPPLR